METKESMDVPSKMECQRNHENTEREKWSHKIEYLLSMIGYCVGLGNIWRFPYICMRNGGGAFLIPFIFFLVTCGLPLYFLEVSIGQFMGKDVVSVWRAFPIFRGIGIGMLLTGAILSFYYNIITTWVIYYIVNSFFNPLPWSTCDNDWNTEFCVSENTYTNSTHQRNEIHTSNSSHSIYNDTESNESVITNKYVTAVEEFWQHNVLQMSSGIDDIGTFPWHLPVCFLAAWILICLCLIKGIKSVGKVVYVTVSLPYLILAVLFVRGITLPGGVDGIVFYLKPDFNRLLDKQVWLEAALQVFFSLGPCWGGLITMSSFNHFKNNCLRDAVMLTFITEGTSIYGGLAIFSIIGYMANNVGKPIDQVIQSGPGLGFIGYPEAIMLLPIPNLWAVLFFVMLLTVALDTLFVTVEILTTVLSDICQSVKNKTWITIGTCLILFLLGLPMCTQDVYQNMYRLGFIFSQLLDWYIATLSIILFGILECIYFGWIYGIHSYSRDVEMMIGKSIPMIFQFCIRFLTPAILMVTFVFTMISYKPPNYGSYYYPQYAQVIGWMVACIAVIPLPVFCVIEIRKAKGRTLAEKICSASRPTDDWKPNNEDLYKEYECENGDSKIPFMENSNSTLKNDTENSTEIF